MVTPVFSASYSGLFKSFFDVLDGRAHRQAGPDRRDRRLGPSLPRPRTRPAPPLRLPARRGRTDRGLRRPRRTGVRKAWPSGSTARRANWAGSWKDWAPGPGLCEGPMWRTRRVRRTRRTRRWSWTPTPPPPSRRAGSTRGSRLGRQVHCHPLRAAARRAAAVVEEAVRPEEGVATTVLLRPTPSRTGQTLRGPRGSARPDIRDRLMGEVRGSRAEG